MGELEINNATGFQYLWLVAGVGLLMVYAAYWKKMARRRFASASMLSRVLVLPSSYERWLRPSVMIVTLLLLVVSLADFRWGTVQRELPQKGLEVMFVLDVSRSMLAEDVVPNRLERAKQMIGDTLDEMTGDRVGLMVFAGEARQRIPMTSHYEDFKITLNDVTPDDLATGGSRLGDAIRAAARGFLTKKNDHQAIVVLTDGEDQESDPVTVASEVFEDQGVRIFTIGLGDFRQGGRVPIGADGEGGYLQFDGQQVWSKLDGKILSQVAQETGGQYIPAGTKLVKMADFYHGYLAGMEQMAFEKASFSRLEARYQWFLALAIITLDLEWGILRRHHKRKDAEFALVEN